MTSGVGGFDSLTLPPDNIYVRNHLISANEKAPGHYSQGLLFTLLSPKGTKFVPTLPAQDVGHGVVQRVLDFYQASNPD